MSLRTVTEKIDDVLGVAVVVISGGLWAVAGFPHLMDVLAFGGLVIACLFIWWLTSRPQKET
jgi:hypothetical protein